MSLQQEDVQRKYHLHSNLSVFTQEYIWNSLKKCSFTWLYIDLKVCQTWLCEKLLSLFTTSGVPLMPWIWSCFFWNLLLPPLSSVWVYVAFSAPTGSGAEVKTEKGCLDSGASMFSRYKSLSINFENGGFSCSLSKRSGISLRFHVYHSSVNFSGLAPDLCCCGRGIGFNVCHRDQS